KLRIDQCWATPTLPHDAPDRNRRAAPPYMYSGSLKLATELRSSAAISARFPIDFAVAVVPADVCDVISWITFIVLEMWPADAACWRAALEMFWISSAS